MHMLLVPYDPFANNTIQRLIEEVMVGQHLYYGSDIAATLGYESDHAFEEVIRTAIHACVTLHVTVKYHFLPLYRQGDDGLYADWKLSRLACTLIVLHADPEHPEVTEAQLQLLRKVV